MSEKTNTSLAQKWRFFKAFLFEKHDGASLAVFRIILGILLMHDVLKIFPIEHGKYNITEFRPSYYGFEWVQADLTLITFFINLMPFTVFCVIFGLFYRLAMPLTTIMVTYMFLIFPEHYLNHYYMLILFCILMSFIPANRVWSLDAYNQKRKANDTDMLDETVPAWCYWILKMQTEVILVYAGLVKINAEWLSLQPLSTWVRVGFFDVPFIGWVFFLDPIVMIGAYGVIILHVFGAPLLFWHKTRPWVFGIYLCFHLTNSALFNIGIFPYMTIGATLLFFNPDWPRNILAKLKPVTTACTSLYKNLSTFSVSQTIIVPLILIWLFIQIVVPIPPLFSSNLKTAWHGHMDMFSWRMMLNNRGINTAVYVVHIPERRRIEFIPLRKFLSARQCTRVAWRPNMTVQFANFLENKYSEKYATKDVRVHAYILLSVNFREAELWADPTKNLAAYEPKYGIHEWIEPIDNPFRSWEEKVSAGKSGPAPTYSEILQVMKLPQEEIIVFDHNNMTLDSRPTRPDCKSKYKPL